MLTQMAVPASFPRVTDAAALKPVFEQELSAAWDRPVKIRDFVVPRVMAGGVGQLLVQYRFSTLGRKWIFWGEVGRGSTPRYGAHAFSIPELQLVVPIFPFDPDLPVLARFFSSTGAVRLLDGLRDALDLAAWARIEDVRVLAYRLGRRAVLRCRVQDGARERSVVAKLRRPRKATRIGHLMTELARHGFDGHGREGIRVPRVLAESQDGILWLEERAEPSLHELVGAPSFVAACGRAARALRRLHAAPIRDLPAWGVETELKRLREIVDETTQVVPDRARELGETLSLLQAEAPGPPSSVTTIHRDFYDKQVLSGSRGTTLLDADTLAAGDPLLDVGNFLAHLVVRACQEPSAAATLADGRRAFLAAYGDLSEARCRFWESVSLARLSCIYSLRPRWRHLAAPFLEEGRRRLRIDGGDHA